MIKKTVPIFLGLVLAGGFILWLGLRRLDHKVPGKLAVVATTGMIADAVRRVAGDKAHVMALMGPGVDPHLYHARESDVQRLASADIIFYNGLHLEGKMGQIFEQMARRVPTYAITDGIDRALLRQSQFAHTYDPHIWFELPLWMKAVEKIRDSLIENDPAHQQEYRSNAAHYLKELAELDAYIHKKVATLPERRRVLITAHDAFSYFGRAYGFTVVSLQGISTDSEVGIGDVMRVVNYIVQHDVPAIFAETSLPQKAIEAVQQAVEFQGKKVMVGPELYSDTLGEPGTVQETYLGMVRSVVDRIVDALQGESQG